MVEIRREDAQPYPPSSIKGILAGLYRYSRECVPTGDVCPNFMNRRDPCFRDLTGSLQVKYRELREKGVGASVKHAQVVLPEEEEKFWHTRCLVLIHQWRFREQVSFMWGSYVA